MAAFVGTSKITKRKHLAFDNNIEVILQTYFKDKSLKVVSVDRKQGKVVEGVNDNFASELENWTICFKGKTDTQDEDNVQTLATVLKATIPTGFQKLMTKTSLTFMREVFWYTEALPTFKDQFPILETMVSPKGYFGYTRYDEAIW